MEAWSLAWNHPGFLSSREVQWSGQIIACRLCVRQVLAVGQPRCDFDTELVVSTMIQAYIDHQPIQLVRIPKDIVQSQSESFLCTYIRILTGISVEGSNSEIARRVI